MTIQLVNSVQAGELFKQWIYEYDPDNNAESYFEHCDFADILTYRVVEPMRKKYINQCDELGLDYKTALPYLYQVLIRLDNDGDTVNHLVVEMMINLIEDYDQPYDCRIKVLDHLGNCIIINNCQE